MEEDLHISYHKIIKRHRTKIGKNDKLQLRNHNHNSNNIGIDHYDHYIVPRWERYDDQNIDKE